MPHSGATATGEIWAPLLEKACANLYGTYENLKGGWSPTGWVTLAGCLDCYSASKKTHGWIRRKIVWASKTAIRYQPAQWSNGTAGDQETSLQTLQK